MFASRCLLAAGASLVACGEPPEPTRFVATVTEDDGGISIGLTIQGDLVAGYACADDPAIDPYPGWFVADAAGESAVTIERDEWIFSASWTDGTARGVLVEPWGEEVAWTAEAAAGLSGTYAARDAGCTTGVVVVDQGGETIVRGAWCNRAGEQRQVTPLGPMELIDGRLLVVVELASGTRTLAVAPVELPILDEQ